MRRFADGRRAVGGRRGIEEPNRHPCLQKFQAHAADGSPHEEDFDPPLHLSGRVLTGPLDQLVNGGGDLVRVSASDPRQSSIPQLDEKNPGNEDRESSVRMDEISHACHRLGDLLPEDAR